MVKVKLVREVTIVADTIQNAQKEMEARKPVYKATVTLIGNASGETDSQAIASAFSLAVNPPERPLVRQFLDADEYANA